MTVVSDSGRRMTMSQELASGKKFAPVILPWLIAAVALAVFFLSMNHWVSMSSLMIVANISGWNWQPDWNGPLYWLVTFPFRWLSPKTIPFALNLFSVVCATLTLKLLARSVALLPHDRTEEQRIRERSPFGLLSIPTAWVPPVLAALVCGFQLTFWEHATAASREIFDLLLFAYVIRCLLEYRIAVRDSWLLRAALVYGAAMAENWAMIGFFPLFLVALVWLKGVSFFNGRFLGRMFVVGSIGLLLYLLLPLVDSFTSVVPVTFWQALKINLASQKQSLFALPFSKGAWFHGFTGDQPLAILAIPSLLPILALSVRWPSYFGDPSKLGVTLATLIFHILHAMLLVVCVWVALDPERFSPRHLVPELPLLTLYYLGALSIGYYVGYFLLVFGGAKPQLRPPRPVSAYMTVINFVVTLALWLLVLAAPTALLYRNLPRIRITNGSMWRHFADLMAEPLTTQTGTVMSDDLAHLFLVEAALAQKGRGKEYVFLDTASLREYQMYHKYLATRYRHVWPANAPPINPDDGKVNSLYLVQLAAKMAETNSLYYLHPSFGYYFELFYPEAHGLIYKLKPYPPNALLHPQITREERGENEAFWTQIDDSALKPLLPSVQTTALENEGTWADKLLKRIHVVIEPNGEAAYLASLYSRALDFWGVAMQRGGYLAQAASHFNRALDLNPDNVVAQINLECNASLQAGRKAIVDLPRSAEERLGKYRTLQTVMNFNGPFDEPTFCFQQGRIFVQAGNYRQSAQELTRVKELVPDNISSRLLLAQIYLFSQMADPALELVQEIYQVAGRAGLDRTNQLELLSIQTTAQLAKGDVKEAGNAVQKVLEQYPKDEELLGLVTRNYLNFGYYTNALETLELELQINPKNPGALIDEGVALLRMSQFTNAIKPLTAVIDLETTNFSQLHYAALLNRAIAYLRIGNLDASQKDYEDLQRAAPTDFRFDYGLGEISYRRKDTNAALRCYNNYLKNAPTNAPEIKNETDLVLGRLKELKPPGH